MCAKIVISGSLEAKVLNTVRGMLQNNVRRTSLPGYDTTVAFEYDAENERPVTIIDLPEDLAKRAGTDKAYVIYAFRKRDDKGE